MLCYAVLYRFVLCVFIVLYCIVLYCTVLYCVILYCIVLLYCTVCKGGSMYVWLKYINDMLQLKFIYIYNENDIQLI